MGAFRRKADYKNDRSRRFICAIKSNFDEADYTPLAMVLDENRVLSFEEYDDYEIESSVYGTKIERATAILKSILLDGPVSIEEVFAEFDQEGIGDRTIRRAMKAMGCISESEHGVTYWRLP